MKLSGERHKKSEEVTIRAKIVNTGPGPAFGHWTMLSVQPPDMSPVWVGQPFDFADLLSLFIPGESYTRCWRYTFPKKGRYTLTAEADHFNIVDEPNEQNNVKSVAIWVEGFPPEISGIDVPTEMYRKEQYELELHASDPDGDDLFCQFPVYEQTSASTLRESIMNWQSDFSRERVSLDNFVGAINDLSSWLSGSVVKKPEWWDEVNKGKLDTNTVVITPPTNMPPGTYYIRGAVGEIGGVPDDNDGASYYGVTSYSDGTDYTDEFSFVVVNRDPVLGEVDVDSADYVGETVSVTASATDPDGDGIEFTFLWKDEDTGDCEEEPRVLEEGEDSVTSTRTYSEPGTYSVTVWAEDAHEAQSGSVGTTFKITEPPPGNIYVITNVKDASYTVYAIYGTDETVRQTVPMTYPTGTPMYAVKEDASPRKYMITYYPVEHYDKPKDETKELKPGSSIAFTRVYKPKTGKINVETSQNEASFNLRGSGIAQGEERFGKDGDETFSDVPYGQWEITFDDVVSNDVSFYCLTQTFDLNDETDPRTIQGQYIQRPVAILDVYGPHDVILMGEHDVTLDGSSSYCPDDGLEIVEYVFSVDYGFGESTIYRESKDSALDGDFDGKYEYAFLTNGAKTVTLKVYDQNKRDTGTEQEVIVKTRPQASPGTIPEKIIAGQTINFSGSGSDADGDEIIGYAWASTIDGDLSDQGAFATGNLSPSRDSHMISFQVQDSDGFWSEPYELRLDTVEPQKWVTDKGNECRTSWQSVHSDLIYGTRDRYERTAGCDISWRTVGSPVAANLDGDWANGLEIAFVSHGEIEFITSWNKLYVTDANGTELWEADIDSMPATPAIGDLRNDCNLCVVVPSNFGVHAFTADGQLLYYYQMYEPIPMYAVGPDRAVGIGPDPAFPMSPSRRPVPPAIADIDMNPENGKEVVVALGRYVDAVTSTGEMLWRFRNLDDDSMFKHCSPAVANVDPSRPGLETIIASEKTLYVIDSTGREITSWSLQALDEVTTIDSFTTTAAIGYLFPGPGADIVIGTSATWRGETVGVMCCVRYWQGTLFCGWFSPQLPGWYFPDLFRENFTDFTVPPPFSSPAIGVVTEQTASQVVFSNGYGRIIVLDGSTGLLVDSWSGSGVYTSEPVIADIKPITVNNRPEVIFLTSSGDLKAVTFWDPAGARGELDLGWDNVGVPDSMEFRAPALADINHDGYLEILVNVGNSMHIIEAVNIYAYNPSPANGALHMHTWVNLAWLPADMAVTHDVYLGDNFNEVKNGTGDTFRGNYTDTFYIAGIPGFAYPDGLVPRTTYYWRIDEVNEANLNSPWIGDVWSFTVPPKTAYNPDPANGAEFVDLEVRLGWTAGFGAILHYVYFGDNFDDVSNAIIGARQATTTYIPGPLNPATTYYWRVDEYDGSETHKGDIWSLTTAPEPEQQP